MSRPIYEPSLQRTDRRLTYTSDQLLRRPAPTSECPCPVPWARLGNGAGTVPNNTWTRVKFGDAMTYNEVAAGYALGDVFEFVDQTDYWQLKLVMDGLYLVHGLFSWDDTFAEFRAIDLQQTLGDHLYSEGYGMTQTKGPFPSTGGPFFNIDWISTFVFKSSSVSAPDPTIDPRAYQSSGVNRGCEGFSVRVMYLGPIGAEADWWFQTT